MGRKKRNLKGLWITKTRQHTKGFGTEAQQVTVDPSWSSSWDYLMHLPLEKFKLLLAESLQGKAFLPQLEYGQVALNDTILSPSSS